MHIDFLDNPNSCVTWELKATALCLSRLACILRYLQCVLRHAIIGTSMQTAYDSQLAGVCVAWGLPASELHDFGYSSRAGIKDVLARKGGFDLRCHSYEDLADTEVVLPPLVVPVPEHMRLSRRRGPATREGCLGLPRLWGRRTRGVSAPVRKKQCTANS